MITFKQFLSESNLFTNNNMSDAENEIRKEAEKLLGHTLIYAGKLDNVAYYTINNIRLQNYAENSLHIILYENDWCFDFMYNGYKLELPKNISGVPNNLIYLTPQILEYIKNKIK